MKMVLRSGIILPFQYRDTKKLLMCGIPEENRDLTFFDLKNVVRAAFGIYNFEFRNKKIGFNIPDELLLHYLAQRHDLTNFVIEINQAHDEPHAREIMSYEPSCSTAPVLRPHDVHVSLPQKSNESSTHEYANTSTLSQNASPRPHQPSDQIDSPMDHTNNSDDHGCNPESTPKPRIVQVYSEHTPESMTQSIDPMDIIPKSEAMADHNSRSQRFNVRQQPRPSSQLQQPPHPISHHMPPQQFFPNYSHSLLGAAAASPTMPPAPSTPQQSQYTPGMVNRFRKRGERMSKDQKELYVKFFEDNPCMLSNRRNDALLEPLWAKLASMLNSVPQGAVKNVEEWKQTFDAWRYRIFMYTRYNSKLSGADAQDPKNYKPLTTTDQRAYAMWTSHKHAPPQDYDKIEMFGSFDETTTAHTDYDY